MPAIDYESLKKDLEKYEQEHLLRFWDSLADDEKYLLYHDIKNIDLNHVVEAYRETVCKNSSTAIDDDLLEPLNGEIYCGVSSSSPEELNLYKNEGLRLISEGKVAVLLLAGGQGTRLGFQYPKGMYNVGLPSNKTLFQMQAERIVRVEKLAQRENSNASVPWYIMTSEGTKDSTEIFFASHNNFGLSSKNIVIFEQETLPCLTLDGKIILEKKHRVARSPDGNGGLYKALNESGVLIDMQKRGVKYVHVYCVDNILVKMADPTFIGYCVKKGAQAGAKVVEKGAPDEAVGIICKVQGNYKVVEYSEISKAVACKREANGRLTFDAGNICNHFFTVDFLKTVAKEKLRYHIAKKKIPFIGENGEEVKPDKPNGVKLEKFVFDVFEFTDQFVVWQVNRDHEFSPLKNGPDSTSDNPRTARHSIYKLHAQYLLESGCQLERRTSTGETLLTRAILNDNGELSVHKETIKNEAIKKDDDEQITVCEISPLLSHEGEDLRQYLNGQKLASPLIISSQVEYHTDGKL